MSRSRKTGWVASVRRPMAARSGASARSASPPSRTSDTGRPGSHIAQSSAAKSWRHSAARSRAPCSRDVSPAHAGPPFPQTEIVPFGPSRSSRKALWPASPRTTIRAPRRIEPSGSPPGNSQDRMAKSGGDPPGLSPSPRGNGRKVRIPCSAKSRRFGPVPCSRRRSCPRASRRARPRAGPRSWCSPCRTGSGCRSSASYRPFRTGGCP